jgi:dethiobiotin synthetase
MSALFVTSTGTGTGKTFVTAGLIRHLRDRGKRVAALKPVVSGFDPQAPEGSDPALLLEALGRPVSESELTRISPFQFRAPLSPDMAARLEGKTLDFESLTRFCGQAIATHEGVLLIEGVGGIMVPLDERRTVLDWMARLRLPSILVAGSYLGTISHTLTALDVLARRDLQPRALVISETPDSAVPLGETLTTLANFTPVPLIVLPRACSSSEHDTIFECLARLTEI